MTMAGALGVSADFVVEAEGGVEDAAAEAQEIGAGNLGAAVAASGEMAIAMGSLSMALNMSQQLREATKEGGSTTGR